MISRLYITKTITGILLNPRDFAATPMGRGSVTHGGEWFALRTHKRHHRTRSNTAWGGWILLRTSRRYHRTQSNTHGVVHFFSQIIGEGSRVPA